MSDKFDEIKDAVKTAGSKIVERIEEETTTEDREEETTEEITIDTDTGERISIDLADNQDTSDGAAAATTETVVTLDGVDLNSVPDEQTGLTTNQILLGILGTLNTSNKLRQETNKRLRDQNKILRRMAGLVPTPDKTVQGTSPKNHLYENTRDVESTGLPE